MSDKVLKEIIRSKQNIKNKIQLIHRNVEKSENFVRTHMSPLVTPLQEIANQNCVEMEEKQSIESQCFVIWEKPIL